MTVGSKLRQRRSADLHQTADALAGVEADDAIVRRQRRADQGEPHINDGNVVAPVGLVR